MIGRPHSDRPPYSVFARRRVNCSSPIGLLRTKLSSYLLQGWGAKVGIRVWTKVYLSISASANFPSKNGWETCGFVLAPAVGYGSCVIVGNPQMFPLRRSTTTL